MHSNKLIQIQNSKYISIVVLTFFSALFFFAVGIFVLLETKNAFNFVSLIFLFFMFFLLFDLYRLKKVYTAYFFYILMSFFFMYDRILFYFFDSKKYNYTKITFPIVHTFEYEVVVKFLCISFVSFFFIHLIYLYHRNGRKEIKRIIPDFFTSGTKDFYKKIGFFLMILSLFPLLYKYYIQINFIKQFPNYAVANFAYEGEGPAFPWWTRGMGTFFILGFLLWLYSTPKQQSFKFGLVLYLIIQAGTSLKGGRAFLFAFVLTIPLLYKKLFNKEFKKGLLIIIAIILVVMAIFVQYFRSNVKIVGDISFFDILASFLYGQGTTIGVPLLYLENQENLPYHNYPFIFAPLVNTLLRRGGAASLQVIKIINTASLLLTYYVNPKLFFMGNGLGDNFLTEMYDFGGYFGVIFLSVVFAFILRYIDNKKTFKGFELCFVFYLYQYILFLPRNSFFGIMQQLKYYVLLFFTILVIDFFITSFKEKLLAKNFDYNR